jgi:hypothetical protein
MSLEDMELSGYGLIEAARSYKEQQRNFAINICSLFFIDIVITLSC